MPRSWAWVVVVTSPLHSSTRIGSVKRIVFGMSPTFQKPSRRGAMSEIARLKQLTSAHCSFCDMLCGCNEVNLDC
jgi:hypothetical protein